MSVYSSVQYVGTQTAVIGYKYIYMGERTKMVFLYEKKAL